MATTSSTGPQRSQLALTRSPTNQVLTGLAGGIGERVGVEPAVIRAAFVALSFATGFGAVAYAVLWLFSDRAEPEVTGQEGVARAALSGPRQLGAIGAITCGLLLILRETGLWIGDGLVWPAAMAAFGVSVIWIQGEGPLKWSRSPAGDDEQAFSARQLVRIGVGALLIVVGMATALAANMQFTFRSAIDLFLPLMIAVAGLSLIFGPWVFRLAHDVANERRERIRSQERSEVAAHLHDSVLQTLALIQRAGSPREMSTLARVQERELRAWLYGKSQIIGGDSLEARIESVAARVEQLHGVHVETVVVGDARLDERIQALVGACSEAMTNSARHSGDGSISVYVEVENDQIVAYVRDHGRGFDPTSVPEDRRGIADSIVGRMKAHGGTSQIESIKETGTEVTLRIPR